MKFLKLVVSVSFLLSFICGCENLAKDTRQTGKNINSMVLGGYSKDLYKSR